MEGHASGWSLQLGLNRDACVGFTVRNFLANTLEPRIMVERDLHNSIKISDDQWRQSVKVKRVVISYW